MLKSYEDIEALVERFSSEEKAIAKQKNADYSGDKADQGDPLFNIRSTRELGITDSVCQGILARLGDKFLRLVSLTKDPRRRRLVRDEAVFDTIKDMRLYLVYLYGFYEEEGGEIEAPIPEPETPPEVPRTVRSQAQVEKAARFI